MNYQSQEKILSENDEKILNLEQEETIVKHIENDQLNPNLYNFIEEYYHIFVYIFISFLLILFQYIQIPLIQGKLNYYKDQYQIILIISIISFFICIPYFFKGIEQENLYNEQILRINTISDTILKYLNNLENKQSFERLLSCKKRFDILECYALDPKQFLIDYIECIMYQIQDKLQFIEYSDKKKIIDLINPINLSVLTRKISSDPEKTEFKQLIEKLKTTQLNDIIQQNIEIDGVPIDYHYFLNLLKDVDHTYKEIKKSNLVSRGNEFLREFANVDNSKIQIKNTMQNSSSSEKQNQNQSQFEITNLYKIIEKIKMNNEYTINVDNFIRDIYQEDFETNKMDVKRIYELIQDKEGVSVVHNSLDNNETFATMKIHDRIIDVNVRQAEDKTAQNIGKKIQRKKLIPENIPWSIKLIKDWKRMSIVMKTELDIFQYIENKKMIFGEDFSKEVYFEKEQMVIRIQEIKNGFFNIKSDEESGNQRDLKIIYEILAFDQDLSFFIECQVNLENLIIQKKIDHTIYDFMRVRKEFEILKQRQVREEWMEGNTRLIIQIMRIIFIIIAISSIGISLSIILNDINFRLRTIQHANEKIKVSFIQGHYPNNICYSIDNSFKSCIGETKINILLKDSNFGNFKFLKSDGDSLIGIGNDQQFLSYKQNDFNNLIINEKIYDVKTNNNLLCYSRKTNVKCIHRKIQPNIIKSNTQNLCINSNNRLDCQNEKFQVPNEFIEGVEMISVGQEGTCAIKLSLFICWGSNEQGRMDIPSNLTEVQIFSLGTWNACAGGSDQIVCWGRDFTSEFYWSQSDEALSNIPEPIKSGADSVKVGSGNACAMENNLLQCWGMNLLGLNEVPEEVLDGIYVQSLNESIACAQKVKLVCWGYDKMEMLPTNDQQQVNIIEMSEEQMCVSGDDYFDCYGGGQDSINKLYFPAIVGADQIALGQEFYCVSKLSYVECFGETRLSEVKKQDLSEKEKYDEMLVNWSLPDITHAVSNVQICRNKICLYRDKLQCQNLANDNLITPIHLPSEIIHSNYFQIADSESICGINHIGTLSCWFKGSFRESNIIPDDFDVGTKAFALGFDFQCAATATVLKCWGHNQFGETDIPEAISSVHTLSAKGFQACAGNLSKLLCWGFYQVNEQLPVEVEPIPDGLLLGVEEVQCSQTFACALEDRRLWCWGMNLRGELDIPPEFLQDQVEMFSVGLARVCAQNGRGLSCWGLVQSEQVPISMRAGAQRFNSCDSVDCALKDNKWLCWGSQSLPTRLSVEPEFIQEGVKHLDIALDYDIAIKYENHIQLTSRYFSVLMKTLIFNVYESLFCMQQVDNDAQFCLVDQTQKNRFLCINSIFDHEQQNDFIFVGDSNIVKISCGTNHACSMFRSGEVHCFGGSKEYDEANLTPIMINSVYDIRAGQNSTCILNSNQIICRGKVIYKENELYDLTSLQGFDAIVKLNF